MVPVEVVGSMTLGRRCRWQLHETTWDLYRSAPWWANMKRGNYNNYIIIILIVIIIITGPPYISFIRRSVE